MKMGYYYGTNDSLLPLVFAVKAKRVQSLSVSLKLKSQPYQHSRLNLTYLLIPLCGLAPGVSGKDGPRA
jgi:hypothetical protein